MCIVYHVRCCFSPPSIHRIDSSATVHSQPPCPATTVLGEGILVLYDAVMPTHWQRRSRLQQLRVVQSGRTPLPGCCTMLLQTRIGTVVDGGRYGSGSNDFGCHSKLVA